MLKIRLQRVGRKHEPTFRLVLTDHKNSTKSGRFKEILGSYDARKTTELFKTDRIKHWLSMGAHPTDTVHNLLVNQKVIDAKKKNVLPKKTYNPQPTTDKTEVESPLESPSPKLGEGEGGDVVPDVAPETSVESEPEVSVLPVEAPAEDKVETPEE